MHLLGLAVALAYFTATFQFPSLSFGDEEESRIFDGREARQGEFPWMVLLEVTDPDDDIYANVCGGFIISKSYLLTAAHCVVKDITKRKFAKVEDIVGKVGNVHRDKATEVEFSEMHIHPSYSKTEYADIAILKFKTPLEKFDNNVQRICIADKGKKYDNKQSIVQMGWGCFENETDDVAPILKTTDKGYLLNDASCKVGNVSYVRVGRLCVSNVKGERVCEGDSGGPLCLIKGTDKLAIGIASVQYYTFCAPGRKYPSLFTDISYFADWINSTVQNNDFCWKI